MITRKYDPRAICLDLMKADSEDQVIDILRNAGFWELPAVWRYYGGRASNFNTIGNQQSRPDAALVEKLVNSIDSRLINECLARGIDPEGPDAPQTIREAVARFFDNESTSSTAGLIREWLDTKRTEIAKGITLAATGYKPNKGNPCFIVSDCGEGQTPDNLPNTILSLDRDNKVKVPFVQGKFNMGGTGVLEFCGKRNLQLVVSRRNPKLIAGTSNGRDSEWGFTIVRREDPIGGRKTSVYTYLAPVNSDREPTEGAVLSFPLYKLGIFPEGQNPLGRESEWGTLIKLYEYSTAGFSRSNILMSDGLMRQLDLLLTDLALPIRLYECRDYGGHSGSYETNLTGIGVRLEDGKGNNLEDDPYSISMQVSNEKMTANLYVFKKGKADTYKSNEGIIFSLNGQTHGYLSKDFFRRKRVGMSYLADSLLVTIDCSRISARSRELLFMPSRDRLRDGELKLAIESELEEMLSKHPGLLQLREKRRREELESILDNAKPLGDILEDLIKDSPTLTTLFLKGTRLSNPFKMIGVEQGKEEFNGKKFPTYFKIKDLAYGATLRRNCYLNMRSRITFETDAENMYFQRNIDPGTFRLFLKQRPHQIEVNHAINLWNGIATLNIPLPENSIEGDILEFAAIASDETRVDPFKNKLIIEVLGKSQPSKAWKKPRKTPPSDKPGKDREKPTGIDLPNIVEVAQHPGEHQKRWDEMDPPFNEYTALRLKHAGMSEINDDQDHEAKDIYDFFVNVDNLYLKTEQKSSKEEADVLQAKFVYGLVLIGLALINFESQKESSDGTDIEKEVEETTAAISSVLVPMINELGGLELEEL